MPLPRSLTIVSVVVKGVESPLPRQVPLSVKDDGDLLAQLQSLVGGFVESVRIGANAVMLINEDGRSKNLPPNCGYLGPIVFVGIKEGDGTEEGQEWCSLDTNDIRRAFAWCEKHANDTHDGEGSGFALVVGDAKIRKALDGARDVMLTRVAEWGSL